MSLAVKKAVATSEWKGKHVVVSKNKMRQSKDLLNPSLGRRERKGRERKRGVLIIFHPVPHKI